MTRPRKPHLVVCWYTTFGDIYAQDDQGDYWVLDWEAKRLADSHVTWLKRQQRYALLTEAPEKVVRKLNRACVFAERLKV